MRTSCVFLLLAGCRTVAANQMTAPGVMATLTKRLTHAKRLDVKMEGVYYTEFRKSFQPVAGFLEVNGKAIRFESSLKDGERWRTWSLVSDGVLATITHATGEKLTVIAPDELPQLLALAFTRVGLIGSNLLVGALGRGTPITLEFVNEAFRLSQGYTGSIEGDSATILFSVDVGERGGEAQHSLAVHCREFIPRVRKASVSGQHVFTENYTHFEVELGP